MTRPFDTTRFLEFSKGQRRHGHLGRFKNYRTHIATNEMSMAAVRLTRRLKFNLPCSFIISRNFATNSSGGDKGKIPPPDGNHGKTTFGGEKRTLSSKNSSRDNNEMYKLMGKPLQRPAGPLWGPDVLASGDDEPSSDDLSSRRSYIPEIPLFEGDGREKKRILILCTGGTLTMAPDPNQGGALAPVEGAISSYMAHMTELSQPSMPDYVLHEYSPFRDSSDIGEYIYFYTTN
jgi:hypothetical protein